jgi:hypothetical protein
MATGTIERIISSISTEAFDFDALFDEQAEENEWSEEQYAAAARMESIVVSRSGTAEECVIAFTVDGNEYEVEGSFILEGSGALSHIMLDPVQTIVRMNGMESDYTIPDALFLLLTPALEAIAREAW